MTYCLLCRETCVRRQPLPILVLRQMAVHGATACSTPNAMATMSCWLTRATPVPPIIKAARREVVFKNCWILAFDQSPQGRGKLVRFVLKCFI